MISHSFESLTIEQITINRQRILNTFDIHYAFRQTTRVTYLDKMRKIQLKFFSILMKNCYVGDNW